jgi:site-specific recombinase XerD
MLVDTGMRIGELASLKANDIKSDSGWVKIKDKGAKERV